MTDYFANLERELVEAARRQRGSARSPQRAPAVRHRRSGRRTVVAALGLTLLAGGSAAAVAGVFRPDLEPDGLVRLSERRTLAEGTTPDGRRWELTGSQSDAGFCLGLRLSNQLPGVPGTSDSEGCGGKPAGSLTVGTSSGGDSAKNGIAFGTAPDRAVRVRAQARGISVTVDTIDDNAGLDGRVYLVELPIRRALGPTTVNALDADGQKIGSVSLGSGPR